jgi:hypothetical protein
MNAFALFNTKFYASVLLLAWMLTTSCTQNDAQREFEEQAFTFDDNITQTNGSGQIVDENEDPDDWRTAPFYSGLVFVDPIFPNPVLTNDRLTLNILITGNDAVSGLRIYSYPGFSRPRVVYDDVRRPLPPGTISVSLNPLDLTPNPESAQGTYRVVVLDANENVISYGDVRIE